MRQIQTRAPWAAVLCSVLVMVVAHSANQSYQARLQKAMQERPESAAELMRSLGNRNVKVGPVPPGALRAAMQQKAVIAAKASSIPGAAGTWREYGKGNLRAATGWIASVGDGAACRKSGVGAIAASLAFSRAFSTSRASLTTSRGSRSSTSS